MKNFHSTLVLVLEIRNKKLLKLNLFSLERAKNKIEVEKITLFTYETNV